MPEEPEQTGETADVTELRREHERLEALAAGISSLEPGAERARVAREAAAYFPSHAQAEERHLYPALRRFLPEGESVVAEELGRQRAIERVLGALQATGDGDIAFDALATQLAHDLQQHIAMQDSILLPTLLEACPAEEVSHLDARLRADARP
jgi:hemerythrin superfamily protein